MIPTKVEELLYDMSLWPLVGLRLVGGKSRAGPAQPNQALGTHLGAWWLFSAVMIDPFCTRHMYWNRLQFSGPETAGDPAAS